jgi:cobalt-zinc-cadmium efflux system protein
MLKEKYGISHSTIQMEVARIHNHGEYGKQFLQNQEERRKTKDALE